MTTSSFFNLYNNRQEQNLVEDLINEVIHIKGFTGYYIPNSNEASRDLLFGDDPLKKFENAYPLSLFLSNGVDPGMNNDFFSKFGLEIKNSVRVQLPRREFARRVPQADLVRPREGDLIYIPFLSGVGELYEIKYCNDSPDFYTLARKQPYYYELELELFKYSHDEINTGVEDIDVVNIVDAYAIEYTLTSGSGDYVVGEFVYQGASLSSATAFGKVANWNFPNKVLKLTNISGTFANNSSIIGSTSNASYIIQSFNPMTDSQIENPFDNMVIENEIRDVVDLSEINPLGML